MEDGIGQETPADGVEINSQETPNTEQTPSTDEGGYNPAWEPLRQQLGLQFETIKPELAKIDKNYHDHITKVNGQYGPWKQFAEQGVTPEQVSQAFTMLQRINEAPEEIYSALGQFLEENGRLPTPAEAQQLQDEGSEGDEYESDAERQMAELQKQIEDLKALQEQQEQNRNMEALQAKAEREVEEEYSTYKTAHPELSEEDWAEIQRRHFAYALQGPQAMKSLEEVGQEYTALVDRIRSAPRPNDLAPRLPGAGGAAPAPQSKDASQFSREESQDALADLLLRAKQNQ